MRRLCTLVLLASALLMGGVCAASASAQPILNGRSPLVCPDPSVIAHRAGPYRYYLACTSDFSRSVFPIWGSKDLLHWTPVADMWSHGAHPWWADPPGQGRYWAPDLTYIGHRWVVYFAATQKGGMVIGVAWSRSLRGPWRTKVLHWRGQFNALGGAQESYGGVIDPGELRDPVTGERYLVWAEQHSSIWDGRLSRDGLTLEPHIHQILWVWWPGWDCEASAADCTIEGPALDYHDGYYYLFFSAASTWDASYAVGAAISRNPFGVFKLLPRPILRSGHGWLGPGGSQLPVSGPNGRQYLFYHASRVINIHHENDLRYLLVGRFWWDGILPRVNGNGLAG